MSKPGPLYVENGQRVAARRRELGLTQQEAADRGGLVAKDPRSYWAMVERGAVGLNSYGTRCAIAKGLGLSMPAFDRLWAAEPRKRPATRKRTKKRSVRGGSVRRRSVKKIHSRQDAGPHPQTQSDSDVQRAPLTPVSEASR